MGNEMSWTVNDFGLLGATGMVTFAVAAPWLSKMAGSSPHLYSQIEQRIKKRTRLVPFYELPRLRQQWVQLIIYFSCLTVISFVMQEWWWWGADPVRWQRHIAFTCASAVFLGWGPITLALAEHFMIHSATPLAGTTGLCAWFAAASYLTVCVLMGLLRHWCTLVFASISTALALWLVFDEFLWAFAPKRHHPHLHHHHPHHHHPPPPPGQVSKKGPVNHTD